MTSPQALLGAAKAYELPNICEECVVPTYGPGAGSVVNWTPIPDTRRRYSTIVFEFSSWPIVVVHVVVAIM